MKINKKVYLIACLILSILVLSACGFGRKKNKQEAEPTPSAVVTLVTPVPTASVVTTPAATQPPVVTPTPVVTTPVGVPTPAVSQAPAGTPTPTPAATAAPTPAPTPIPTAAPTPVQSNLPRVTKSPTSETVQEGGKATFVAHAANATGITWRLVSSDGMATINASAASMYFDGVSVWGLGTDSLTISNIPANMNHWQVEAMFDGPNGPVYSAGARISVIGSNANGTTTDRDPNGRVVANTGVANGTSPVITSQPEGAELTSGKSTTLSVTASVNDGSTIRYQWYVSTSNDNAAGQAIAGATSASYTPGEIQGTRYYYVGVWSEKDGAKSDTVVSGPAAVVYSGPAIAIPMPVPRPAVTTAAATRIPIRTPTPTAAAPARPTAPPATLP